MYNKQIKQPGFGLRRVVLTTLLIILFVSCVFAPALASGGDYLTTITVSNNGSAANNVFGTFSFSTAEMISGNMMNAAATDCAMIDASGIVVAFMPSANASYPWCTYIPSINSYSSLNQYLYSGGAINGKLCYFPGSDGMAITHKETMNLGDNFEFVILGYIDATAGNNKDIIFKEDAFRLFVSDTVSGNITASITGGASVTAPGIGPGDHTVVVSANVTHLSIRIDTIVRDIQPIGASVPVTGYPWIFFRNNVMPYVEYIKLWK